MRLKDLCLRAVGGHLAVLGPPAVLDIPVLLLQDLLPHLTVCQLDELQPGLNKRGISTLSRWIGIIRDMCGPNHVIDVHTEEEAKHKVMRMLFVTIVYGFTNSFVERNATNVNTPGFLWSAARHIRQFPLIMSLDKSLQGLTAELWPLLNLLEKSVRTVSVSQSTHLGKRKTQTPLYVLHRLLDHGVAKSLIVDMQCPHLLAWLLHGRGSQYLYPQLRNFKHTKEAGCVSAASAICCGQETRTSQEQNDQSSPRKRPKMDSVSLENEEAGETTHTVDPHLLCQMFNRGHGPSVGVCSLGQIETLEIRQCGSDSLRVLNSALPTFFCLRSLTVHSFSTFRNSDVLDLAQALRLLSDSSLGSLANLDISVLPHIKLILILLDASPNITSLHVEIQSAIWGPTFSSYDPRTTESSTSELPLKNLTVKVTDLQTHLHPITAVLRRSPHLSLFHISGMRLTAGSSESQLLTTLSESNHFLKSLMLEDLKLSDCLPEILKLLSDCKLEELQLNDCRLLEKWTDKTESLHQLVVALKKVPSLHTLGLAQNRLAKNVCVLAELFSGCSPSSVNHLNLNSNFIQPADLLEFMNRLRTHHPQHQVTLDLRKNPGDRDPDTWNTAIEGLQQYCVVLVEGWISTNTMADHISNM
ncbi:leucine-rich repeat-containing protein 41 [Antennarius striatus]|uniref:leucine-rich repeat-containing protein 41 n=1 Tax=Antennarius striatus TaxID=241820 RepID=UPI0035B002C7